MGKALLVGRLAVKDIRYRPVQAALLLLAIAAAAATLTLGLALKGTTDSPYARTRAATNGPDVVATLLPGGSNGPGPATSAHPGAAPAPGAADTTALVRLEHARGVVGYSGPFPVTWTLLKKGHTTGSAEVEGRPAAFPSIDRPKILRGSWVRPQGVVVEAAYANAMGLAVGDRLSLGGRSFDVVGTAVTAAIPDYPDACSHLGCFLAGLVSRYNPGLVWATPADARLIAGAAVSTPAAYFLNLKISDPARAVAFADRFNATASPTAPYLYSWLDIRAGDAQVIAKVQQVLLAGSWLLSLLAIASVVVLVGGRMADQTRRVGLLKAVGGTPRLVAAVLLCEHVLIGLAAAITGLAIGWLTAPLLDGPGAGLIGAANAPSLTGATVIAVIALALAVAIVATFVPAVRAARHSTVAALEDPARTPRRRQAVIRLSAHLPPALLIGLRLAVRRPRRLLLSVLSVAITASGMVTVLVWHATAGSFAGARVAQAAAIISAMLIVLTAVNTVFIGWTTALDIRPAAALARALGASADQITSGLSVAQVLPALAGALLGIPGGLAIYDGARSGPGPATVLPATGLVVMVAATLLVVTVLTAIPARIGARRSVATLLQSETA